MADQAEALRALARQARLRPGPEIGRRAPRRARIIAVSSGKGGVGKTNVAVNLAVALGQAGRRTLILDADLGLANVDVVLGISPPYSLGDVISGERRLEEIIVDGPSNVRVIPGASGLRELANLSDPQRDELIRRLGELEHEADLILIDTGAGISTGVSEFIRAAQEVLVVVTPEPTSITDAYALIKIVAQEPMPPAFHLVVNQVEGPREAEEVIRKLTMVIRHFLGVVVDSYGYLPRDPMLTLAVRRQVPAVLAYPQSDFSRRIYALSRRILGEQSLPVRPTGFFGFLQRVSR